MEIVMLLIAVLIVILIMYVSMYNKLVKSRNSVLEAKSGIDISLLKRFDLITDLVEVVKGYTKYESETLNKLISLRNNNNSEFNETNESLNEITNSLNVVIEKYPDLKASEQFLNLQKNMANVEEHLQASRRFYNNN
ncbi:MAG: LemA family protein, partial [Erysipelothrix sp.]|nr:LemA family protein [Erysipelothrix sp.]